VKHKLYTIQVIPPDSGKTKIYKIHRITWKIFFWLLVIIVLFSLVLAYKMAEINTLIITSKQIKFQNEKLIEKQNEYALYFEQLDSIYSIDNKIQNILQTYYENDSNKINSILEKNKFNHISSSKVKLDVEGLEGWQENTQNKDMDKIPNILPVIGIISKKYSEEDTHYGTDFAANQGDPIFATASGSVIFAGSKDDLGLTIILDHGNGYQSSYSHLQRISVRKKAIIKKGEVIGFVGSTGNSTGPHLHYEITLQKQHLDPETLFNE